MKINPILPTRPLRLDLNFEGPVWLDCCRHEPFSPTRKSHHWSCLWLCVLVAGPFLYSLALKRPGRIKLTFCWAPPTFRFFDLHDRSWPTWNVLRDFGCLFHHPMVGNMKRDIFSPFTNHNTVIALSHHPRWNMGFHMIFRPCDASTRIQRSRIWYCTVKKFSAEIRIRMY